ITPGWKRASPKTAVSPAVELPSPAIIPHEGGGANASRRGRTKAGGHSGRGYCLFGALILTGVVGVLFAVDPASSANYSECMAQAERRRSARSSLLASIAQRPPSTPK